MSTARFIVGDTREVLATLEPNSVDLVLSSPPFLALRSYLPADDPLKSFEMGSEATPGEFIDKLLDVTEACARVLAPHGSLVFELGDTFSGSGGAGGDYLDGGLREDQPAFKQRKPRRESPDAKTGKYKGRDIFDGNGGEGWPMAKSLCLIPETYRFALVYGHNPHTARQTPCWRARNVVRWVRPNPPVGALCVDDQTEALTPDGWKRHDQLSDGELIAAYDPKTDSCRFLPASFVRWEREGEPMVVIDKKATTQWLTEDHRVWTKTRKTDPHVCLARDLTNDCETLLCAPFDDVSGPAPTTVERAALLGWFIAEGTAHHRQSRIVQSLTANPQKVARIRSLLETDGADFRETSYVHRTNGTTIITFHVKGELAEWLNLHPKRLPMSYVTTWPDAQAQALFDALIDGDGHRRKNAEGVLFHQQNEAVAEAVQVLAIRLGYRASKFWQPSLGLWQITMSRALLKDRRWTKIRKWDGEGIRRELYTGTVWCPMVETSFWLARRDGKTFITGNSDKFRPATSELVVACKAKDRWFDLDATRTEHATGDRVMKQTNQAGNDDIRNIAKGPDAFHYRTNNPASAPPLDWWSISPSGFAGAHYATFPAELCVRPIEAMCPRRVCRTCGKPSRREVDIASQGEWRRFDLADTNVNHGGPGTHGDRTREATTTGWSSCGCPGTDGIRLDGYHTGTGWRPGLVLDPFVGSGTTLMVAHGHGRDSLGIDIDSRNADLARERLGMFLTIEEMPHEREIIDHFLPEGDVA